jgi:hypothetical protein
MTAPLMVKSEYAPLKARRKSRILLIGSQSSRLTRGRALSFSAEADAHANHL